MTAISITIRHVTTLSSDLQPASSDRVAPVECIVVDQKTYFHEEATMQNKVVPIYASVATCAAITLLLELTQTRVLSFVFWNHAVYLTVSIGKPRDLSISH